MSDEVTFDNIDQMRRILLKQYMDEYLKTTGLKADQVVLVEGKDNVGNKVFYFTKRTEVTR